MMGISKAMKTSDRLAVLAKMQTTHHPINTFADVISVLGYEVK
jgi:hypothetical protein